MKNISTMKKILMCGITALLAVVVSMVSPAEAAEVTFSDVTQETVFSEDITWANENGYLGHAEKFRPLDPITLAEAITLEERAFDIVPVITNWSDWSGSLYWERRGPMQQGPVNYATEIDTWAIVGSVFNIPGQVLARYNAGNYLPDGTLVNDRPFQSTLYGLGVCDEQILQKSYITRAEFIHILREAKENKDFNFGLNRTVVDPEMKISYYGTMDDHISNMIGMIPHLMDVIDPRVKEAYLATDYQFCVVPHEDWFKVINAYCTINDAAAFVSPTDKIIWMDDSFLGSSNVIIHELGHMVHNLGNDEQLLGKLYAYRAQVSACTGWDYPSNNPQECFAETFQTVMQRPYNLTLQEDGDQIAQCVWEMMDKMSSNLNLELDPIN